MPRALPHLTEKKSDKDYLLVIGRKLGPELEKNNAYKVMYSKAANVAAALNHPDNWQKDEVNPFAKEIQNPSDPSPAQVFAEKFLFNKIENIDPNSVADILDATFNSLSGTFANLFEILQSSPDLYTKSKAALEIIETQLKKIFVKNLNKKTVDFVEKSTLALRYRLLKTLFSSKRKDIIHDIRQLLLTATYEQHLLPYGEEDSSENHSLTPTSQAVVFYTALVEKELHKSDRKQLQVLYSLIKEMQPLWKAFRFILAKEIMDDLTLNSDSPIATLLLPLITPEGLHKALALGKTEDDRVVKTFFGALDVFEQYCSDVEPATGFDEDASNVSTPQSLPLFIKETVLKKSDTIGGWTYSVVIRYEGIFSLNFDTSTKVRSAGSNEIKQQSYYENSHHLDTRKFVLIPFNPYIAIFSETKGEINQYRIDTPSVSTGWDIKLNHWGAHFKGYNDGWFVVDSNYIVVKIGEKYYTALDSHVAVPKVLL